MKNKCHCGKPLHYKDKEMQKYIQRMVDELGEDIPVKVIGKNGGDYLVQRHYIALHGIKAKDILKLGFKKI